MMTSITTKSILNQVEDIFLSPVKVAPASKPLKILIVGAEVSPYAHVGGVSRALGHLSKALVKQGQDCRVFMPKFGMIDEEKYPMRMVYEGLKVPTSHPESPYLICNVKMHQASGRAPVYFLENQEYYELRANVYGYQDDPTRWALLSRGVLEFLACCSDWVPDVVEAVDWQAGAIPNHLRSTFAKNEKLFPVATVFSIHNLNFQGMFDYKNVSELNFDDGQSPIENFFSERLYWQNFMRRGIMYADLVNTVSPNYAKEILRPQYGEGLDKLLTEVRGKLFGILNGIDYEEFNPATDKFLKANFDVRSLEKRGKNKLTLQGEFDLKQDETLPLLATWGRFVEQKGIDLMFDVLPPLLRDFEVQFVVVGGGEGKYLDFFRQLQKDFPKKVGIHLMADFTLPRLLMAGADLILFPSKFEPCGLVQMEGMRYGAIPIVRATGGLTDTVEDFDPEKKTGVGFVFKDFDKWAFFAQIVRALEVYRHKEIWRALQKRAMLQDNSWEQRALEYLELFQKATDLHKKKLMDEGRIERIEDET